MIGPLGEDGDQPGAQQRQDHPDGRDVLVPGDAEVEIPKLVAEHNQRQAGEHERPEQVAPETKVGPAKPLRPDRWRASPSAPAAASGP